MPPTDFATVLTAMEAAHYVGDYLLQTDHQATNKPAAAEQDNPAELTSKGQSWRANQAHVANYHAAQLAALALVSTALPMRMRPSRVAAGMAFSWVTHSVIDRRWPVRAWMQHTGSSAFYDHGGAAHADQAMHHAALFISALIIARD